MTATAAPHATAAWPVAAPALPFALPARPLLVVGGYGYRNAGDEAILAGFLRLVGRDGVTVVSRLPAETEALHDVRAVGLAAAPRALTASRGLVIGGGGLFGADMGALGRLLPLVGLAAAATDREVALVGVGVDREAPPIAARLLGALARRAVAVVVRDEGSRTALGAHGVAALVQPDLSAHVPSAGRDAGIRHLRAVGLDPTVRPVVLLCLTAVNAPLAARVAAILPVLVDAMPRVDFCLVPMSRHPFVARHNDAILARALVAARPRLRVLEPPGDTGELLGIFEAASAVVAMRYHSLLFAERAGIPIVPIAYAEKCRRWIEERHRTPVEPHVDAILAGLEPALGTAIA